MSRNSQARQIVAFTGTVKPCDVLAALRTPGVFTSKRGTISRDIPINSLAVSNAPSAADDPRAKRLFRTAAGKNAGHLYTVNQKVYLVAIMILTMAILPLL
jgi:hypothetical protein